MEMPFRLLKMFKSPFNALAAMVCLILPPHKKLLPRNSKMITAIQTSTAAPLIAVAPMQQKGL